MARNITGFLTRFALAYALFVLPWPGLERTYAECQRIASQALLGHFGSAGAVRFRIPTDDAWPGEDIRVTLSSSVLKRTGTVHFLVHSRQQGYLPIVLTLSLILATRLKWRTRVRVLAIGLLASLFFVFLKTELQVIVQFASWSELGVFPERPAWSNGLYATARIFSRLTGKQVIPVAIWIATTWTPRGGRSGPHPADLAVHDRDHAPSLPATR